MSDTEVPTDISEVPAPDALEQSRPVDAAAAVRPARPSTDAEAPEADALEQSLPAPLDEDDAPR